MVRTVSKRGCVSTIPTKYREAMGAALRKVRTEARLSQGAFAELVGVTQAAVSQWECGVRDMPASLLLEVDKFGIKAIEILMQAQLEVRSQAEGFTLPPHSSRRATAR